MILRGTTANFRGVELAFFRLKRDVNEAQLLALSEQVNNMFLTNQEGLLARFLLRGNAGLYVDMTFATTQARAEEICQLWLSHAAAKAYLKLLDERSVDMSFWTRIG
ncbi:MAG: hypothetical protein MJA28_12640 [Gammaproteobacteria bacterium]|nr:hypothetical protein [Gammaproteobacteria bacterium]